jgi:hypothetical protein
MCTVCPRARPGILERTRIRSWRRARQRTMRSPRRRRGMVITSTPSPREPCWSLRFRAHPRTGSLTSLVSRPHSGHRSGGGWSAVTNLNPQWGHDSSRTGRSSGAWGSSRSGSWFTMSHVLFSCVVCQYTDPVAAGRTLSPATQRLSDTHRSGAVGLYRVVGRGRPGRFSGARWRFSTGDCHLLVGPPVRWSCCGPRPRTSRAARVVAGSVRKRAHSRDLGSRERRSGFRAGDWSRTVGPCRR